MELKYFLANCNVNIKEISREEYKRYLKIVLEKNNSFSMGNILEAIKVYFNYFDFINNVSEDEIEILKYYFKLNSRYKKTDMRKVAYYIYENNGINSVYDVFQTFEKFDVIKELLKQARFFDKLDKFVYELYLSGVPLTILSDIFKSIAAVEKCIIMYLIKSANMDEFLYISSKNHFIEFEIAKLIENGYNYEIIRKRYSGRVKEKYDMAKKLIETFPSYYEQLKNREYNNGFNKEGPVCYIRSSSITRQFIY